MRQCDIWIRREQVGQIAGVECPRIALDAVQARVMGKPLKYPSNMADVWKDDGSGRWIEDQSMCENFDDAYL